MKPEEAKTIVDAVKYGQVLPISLETAMDYGLIPDTRPTVAIPRRTRLRWAITGWWYDHRPHLHFGPCDEGSS